MKNSNFPSLIAATTFTLIGSTVWAQDATSQVQLFGSVAVSALRTSVNNNEASTTKLISGPWSGPSVGMQGSEDLGDGLRANFRIEHGVDASDGSRGQTAVAQTKAFDKAAWVGIGNQTVNLTLGRQINAGIDRIATTMDLFQASADGRQILSILAINGTNTFGSFDTRVDKSAKVRVNAGNGFNGSLSIAREVPGTIAGNSYAVDFGQNTSQYGIGAYYMNYDGAGARVDFSQRTWGVGGNYDFGVVRAYLQYMDARHDKSPFGATQQHDKVWGMGLAAPLSQALTLKAAYYLDHSDSVGGKAQGGNRNTAILMGDYALSKRTTIQSGVYRNGVSGAFSSDPFAVAVNALVGIPAGSTAATNFLVGLTHRF